MSRPKSQPFIPDVSSPRFVPNIISNYERISFENFSYYLPIVSKFILNVPFILIKAVIQRA
jgi:hypothetical protein